jgi:hypothetical protein
MRSFNKKVGKETETDTKIQSLPEFQLDITQHENQNGKSETKLQFRNVIGICRDKRNTHSIYESTELKTDPRTDCQSEPAKVAVDISLVGMTRKLEINKI